MSARTRFTIVRQGAGFMVMALTTWGSGSSRGSAGGPAAPAPFPTREAAIAWVAVQFSVDPATWREQGDDLVAEPSA